MLELLVCDLELFWSKAAGPGGDWGTCGGDVMGYAVFDGLLQGYGLEGALWLPGEKCRAE